MFMNMKPNQYIKASRHSNTMFLTALLHRAPASNRAKIASASFKVSFKVSSPMILPSSSPCFIEASASAIAFSVCEITFSSPRPLTRPSIPVRRRVDGGDGFSNRMQFDPEIRVRFEGGVQIPQRRSERFDDRRFSPILPHCLMLLWWQFVGLYLLRKRRRRRRCRKISTGFDRKPMTIYVRRYGFGGSSRRIESGIVIMIVVARIDSRTGVIAHANVIPLLPSDQC